MPERILEYIKKKTPLAMDTAKETYKGLSPLQRHALTAVITAAGAVLAGQFGTGIPNSPAALGERLATIETRQVEQGKDIELIKNYLINRKGR